MVFRNKAKKKRFAKYNKQTRWAPAWAVLKKLGRPAHPSRITRKRRFWRRHTLDE